MAPRHVAAGEPIDRSIRTHNAFVDAAIALPALLRTPDPRPATFAQVIEARNRDQSPIQRFDAVELGDPVFDPTSSDPSAFNDSAWFEVGRPLDAQSPKAIAIAIEPIGPGEFGKAIIYGVSPIRDITIEDETHTRAKLGTSGELVSAEDGPAEILWKASGPDTEGNTRAVIAIVFARPTRSTRFARITSSASIEGRTNQWDYEFEVVEYDGLGWVIVEDAEGNPITSAELGKARNTIEASNVDGGIQGNGVDADTLPEGFTIVPIGIGAVVKIEDVGGRWIFQAANLVDGECPE